MGLGDMMRAVALAVIVLCGIAAAEQVTNSTELREEQTRDELGSKLLPKLQIYDEIYADAHENGDLPQLPINRSPVDASWNNSVAICALSETDYTSDVREWVQFHKCALF